MKKVQNKFFDLVLFFISFLVSFYRSISGLFGIKNTIKKGSFFYSLDYIFRLWPNDFWKKPTFFKVGHFFGGLIKYIFYKK